MIPGCKGETELSRNPLIQQQDRYQFCSCEHVAPAPAPGELAAEPDVVPAITADGGMASGSISGTFDPKVGSGKAAWGGDGSPGLERDRWSGNDAG